MFISYLLRTRSLLHELLHKHTNPLPETTDEVWIHRRKQTRCKRRRYREKKEDEGEVADRYGVGSECRDGLSRLLFDHVTVVR